MLFGEQPGGSHPTLHHVGIPPARDVAGAALDPALRTFDDVGGGQAPLVSLDNRQKVEYGTCPWKNKRQDAGAWLTGVCHLREEGPKPVSRFSLRIATSVTSRWTVTTESLEVSDATSFPSCLAVLSNADHANAKYGRGGAGGSDAPVEPAVGGTIHNRQPRWNRDRPFRRSSTQRQSGGSE